VKKKKMNKTSGKKILSTVLTAIIVLSAFSAMCTPASAATEEEIEQAIVNGTAWLAAQQNPDGSWPGDWGWNSVATTGFAVLKLEMYAKELGYDPFDPEYEYSNNVVAGLNYIFANAHNINISVQPAGDPDTNGNGIGVGIWANHPTYETGIAMMAIAESAHLEKVVNVPGSPVDGRTYGEVLQDAVDYLAFGQNDADNPQGGWGYDANFVCV